MARILIVDDDVNIAELISLYLNKECYDTQIAYDGEEVVAFVVSDRVFERSFCLFARRGHDGVVVIETHHAEDHVLGDRVIGADEGFRAAGAFKTVQPHDGRSWFHLHGVCNVLSAGFSEAETRRGERAKREEASAADTLAAQGLILSFHGHGDLLTGFAG